MSRKEGRTLQAEGTGGRLDTVRERKIVGHIWIGVCWGLSEK